MEGVGIGRGNLPPRNATNGVTFVVNSSGTEPDSYWEDGICDTAKSPTTPPSGICTWPAVG